MALTLEQYKAMKAQGMTPEQIVAIGKAAKTTGTPPESFFGKVAQHFQEKYVAPAEQRADVVGGMIGGNLAGETKALGTFSQGVGTVGDIAFQATSDITPDIIEKPIISGVGKALEAESNLLNKSEAFRKFTERLGEAMNEYDAWAAKNPEQATALGTVGNVLRTGTALQGLSSTATMEAQAVQKAGQAVGNVAKRVAGTAKEGTAKTLELAKKNLLPGEDIKKLPTTASGEPLLNVRNIDEQELGQILKGATPGEMSQKIPASKLAEHGQATPYSLVGDDNGWKFIVDNKTGKMVEFSQNGESAKDLFTGKGIPPENAGITMETPVERTSIAEYAAAQETGFNPKTIKEILKNPEAFDKDAMQLMSREKYGEYLQKAFTEKKAKLSATGKAYDALRKSDVKVVAPLDEAKALLKNKYGIEIDVDGTIYPTAETVPISGGDKSAIEKFFKTYGDPELTGNAFLNARGQLSEMAKFDMISGKTDYAERISRDIRKIYDKAGKTQIPALGKIDAKYAPQRQFLGEVEKTYLDAQGNLKPTAVNRLVNLVGQGKGEQLAKMEKLMPGITRDLKILKAIEDIEWTQGQKVATYARGATLGGLASGGNPLGAVAGAILTSPSVSLRILKAYARKAPQLRKTIDDIIGNLRTGTPLTQAQKPVFQDAMKNIANIAAARATEKITQ